jgi:integrase
MTQETPSLASQAYLNFVNSIHSHETRYQYEYSLRKFMKYLKINKEEDLLIDAAQPKLIEARIIEYIVLLRGPPHSLRYSTLNLYLAAILAFYAMNDVILNKKKIGKYLGEHLRLHRDRAYTTQEISRALNVCDERMKVIILLLASSGLRIGALPSLQVKHLIELAQFKVYRLIIYEGSREEYYTFCTPEAKQAVDEYLDYRKRCLEKINPDSPLIREQFDRDDSFAVNHPKHMSKNGIQNLLNGVLVRSGLRTVQKETEIQFRKGRIRKEVAMAIGFRKFCNTTLVRAKVNPLMKEIILGHRTGLEDNYFRPQPEEVLEEYIKAVNLLTINDENRLRIKVDELTQKQDEIQLMRSKHEHEMKTMREEMSKHFSQIMSMIQHNPKLAQVKPEILIKKPVK